MTDYFAGDPRPNRERMLGSISPDAHIKPPLFVDYGIRITVRARTFINYPANVAAVGNPARVIRRL